MRDPNEPKEPETKSKLKAAPVGVYIRAVRGEIRHLYTNVVFGADLKKVDSVDGFLQAQIDAGKLEIVKV